MHVSVMSNQHAFYFDSSRCIQCRTCELACKSANNVETGVRWRRLIDDWQGEYPHVARTFFSLACMHCGTPACAAACPPGAISKRPEDGIVVVDSAKCDGCGKCLPACPYGVPEFGEDGKMQKCDFCLGIGREPVCTLSCPTEALSFGTPDELSTRAAGKTLGALDGATEPSIVIVTWD